MPETAQLVSIIGALFLGIAGVLAYFKYKPGQREVVQMDVAQATMNVAQGTFQMVTTELEDQFKRMAAELRELRAELVEVKARADGLSEDLTRVKARLITATQRIETLESENASLRQERDDLRVRVAMLERGS